MPDGPCRCGHTRADHYAGRGECMYATDQQTWACACHEYLPAAFYFLDGGTLDIGIIRDKAAAWGGTWRWWKRLLPRRLWRHFGYVPFDPTPFIETPPPSDPDQ